MAADNDTTGPAGPLTHHERQGFLFAVAAAPDLVPPSEWLHEIYGGAEPAFDDMSEAQASLHAIMEMYNDITTAIAERRAALPADCAFLSETLANLDTDAPVAAWSRGFLQGHQWLIESWDPFVPSDMDEEFAMLLITLTFFATPALAAAYAEELGRPLEEAAAVANTSTAAAASSAATW